jgi:hypothetical protein
LPSLQSSGAPGTHAPPTHVSPPLHRSASAHGVPSDTAVFWHAPSTHRSSVHGFVSAHWASSVHPPQPGIGVFTQPVTGSQLSSVHGFPSSQSRRNPPSGVPPDPPTHAPSRQLDTVVHAFASSHGVPFTAGGFWQPEAGEQLSSVHGLPSAQFSGEDPTHTPATHVSTVVQ